MHSIINNKSISIFFITIVKLASLIFLISSHVGTGAFYYCYKKIRQPYFLYRFKKIEILLISIIERTIPRLPFKRFYKLS